MTTETSAILSGDQPSTALIGIGLVAMVIVTTGVVVLAGNALACEYLRRRKDDYREANRAIASRNSGRMTVKPAVGLLIAAGLVAACSAAPSLTLTEPRDGHEVPVICADAVPAADCRELAAAMLEYLQAGDPTYAKVESIEVEPLGQTLAEDAVGGLVTLDHEMFLSSGRQAYRVVRRADSETFDIEIVLDGEPQTPPE